MKKVLYHGSRTFFEIPDLSQAKAYKDFGRGFYLTTNREQAARWAVRGLRKDDDKSFGYLYVYEFETDNIEKLKHLELLEYNKEWADVVTRYRNEQETEIKYDLIYDRMADSHYDELVEILEKYYRKSVSFDEVLKVAKCKDGDNDQYCYKTKKALKYIQRNACLKVCNIDGEPQIVEPDITEECE